MNPPCPKEEVNAEALLQVDTKASGDQQEDQAAGAITSGNTTGYDQESEE